MNFKPLIFVSGKGGTGKTTMGLFIADQLVREGKKVLFVELAPRSSARALLELAPEPAYKPTPSGLGFDWCLLQGLDCLVEYVSSFTGIESVTQQVFENSLIKTLVNVAPGLNDLSILGKLTSQHRKHGPGFNYDHVVVDSHSTGSFHSLLKAPYLLGKSVSTGPLKSQSEAISKVLKDPVVTQFIFMGLFEELPVDELEDTLSEFHDECSSQIVVVMNKWLALAEPKIDDLSWQSFIKKRIEDQEKQKDRVKDLYPTALRFDLFAGEMKEEMKVMEGEFLRPL